MPDWCAILQKDTDEKVTDADIDKIIEAARKIATDAIPDIPFADVWAKTIIDTTMTALRGDLKGYVGGSCDKIPQDIGTTENLLRSMPRGVDPSQSGFFDDLVTGIMFVGVIAIGLVLILVAAKLMTSREGPPE